MTAPPPPALLRQDRLLLAVLIMLDVAFHAGRNATVSAADIAERLELARRGIEPLLQALSRAGLLVSVRGPKGGYRLGAARRAIRLDAIAAAVTEGETAAADGPGGALLVAVVQPLWRQLDAAVAAQLAAITLEELCRRGEAAGLSRPRAEPISFSI